MNYTVGTDDTISDIAEKFHVPINELMEYNHLSPNHVLIPGMIIMIPPINIFPRPPVTPIPPIDHLPSRYHIYIVKRGDTIWSIARKFNVNVQNIMSINGLRFPFVFPGQRLFIPVPIVPFKN